MRRELERASEETSGFKTYLLATYYFVTGNYSLLVILIGLGMIGFGATVLEGTLAVGPLSGLEHGIFAGMFGVWGASLVVIGVTAYGILWANKMYARMTTDTEDEEEAESEVETEMSL